MRSGDFFDVYRLYSGGLSFLFSMLIVLCVIVQSKPLDGQSHDAVESRAPKTCPIRPDYCDSLNQAPWTCKNGSYCFRNDIITPTEWEVTGLSTNLTADIYYYKTNSKGCSQALNITWKMNPTDIIGFFLRITRNGPSMDVFNRTRDLTFWIDKKRLTTENERENEMVTFYSDCVRLGVASAYRFDLFSLHAVPNSDEISSKSIGVGSLVTDCDTYPEAHPSFRIWEAYTTVKLTDFNSTANIYFTPAARSLGFRSYDLSILKSGSDVVLVNVRNLTFTCSNLGVVVVKNLCSGKYTIKMYAFGGYCPCSGCLDCSRRADFVVEGSKFQCSLDVIVEVPSLGINIPSITSLKVPEETTSIGIATALESNSSRGTQVNSLVIVACVGVIFMAIIGIIVYVMLTKKCKNREELVSGVINDSDENVVIETSMTKQTVLLIYAKDNAYHCDTVRCFAAYLQQHCYCEVKFDQWCPDEISAVSALDWLLLQIGSVENIVIVNSEGGWRQYEGDARSIAYQRTRNDSPLDDMFLPAVKNLRNRFYTQPNTHRVFKVAFPYTHPRYFIGDIHPGRTYQLMDHIDELFLNIHGLWKQGTNGKTAAGGINASDYARCAEGRSLQAAIGRAGEYLQSTPDWFSGLYRQTSAPSPPVLGGRRSASPPEVYLCSVLDSGVVMSAEQIVLDTLFIPPSPLPGDGSDNDDDDDDDDGDNYALNLKVTQVIVSLNQEYDNSLTCS